MLLGQYKQYASESLPIEDEWGIVNEPWYEKIMEIAADFTFFESVIIQNPFSYDPKIETVRKKTQKTAEKDNELCADDGALEKFLNDYTKENKHTKIVCISGKAGSGKDTAAGIMKECLEKNSRSVLITHYADLVKYVCEKFFGWDGVKDQKGRTLLQHVGTDIVRNEDPDYWVDFIADMLGFFKNEWDYVLIPDARFPNEISRLAEKFDVTHLRVERNNYQSKLTETQQSHTSETSLDDSRPDIVLKNNDTLVELKKEIETLVKENLL